MPPENATGNFVKIVQRIPVKIRLDAKDFGNPRAHRGPIRADFGLLSNDRAIDVVDDTTALRNQGDRLKQEMVR